MAPLRSVKCPHCAEQHPDTFYFCTVSGADLQPWENLVGKTYVERYRLKRLLDTAGRGALFEAETLANGEKVAVKIIHPSAARGSNAADGYIQAAATTGSLGHPHLPDGVEAGRDEGGAPYIVRKFVKGQSMGSRVDRNGPLPVDRAVRAAKDVLSALVATHARGLFHQQITPSRIFVTDDDSGLPGNALLMDFGSSALVEAGESAAYRAPEVKDGAGGAAADLYAVCASLYEALTGRPPLGETIAPARSARPEVPEALDAALQKGLSRNPGARFADAETLLAALSASLPAPAPDAPQKPAQKAIKATMLGVPVPLAVMPATSTQKTAAPPVAGPFAVVGETAPLPPVSQEPPAPTEPAMPAHAVAPVAAAAAPAPKPKAKPAPVAPAREERDSVPDFLSQPPIHKRPVVLAAVGGGVLLLVILVFAMSGGEEEAPGGASGPSVRVVIRSNVPGATLFVDGNQAETNPFEGRFPPSDTAHTLRAEAAGFQTKQMLVRFDADREIILDLAPELAASAAPVPPPLPETGATAAPPPQTAVAATAAPRPASAAATTAPEKVASAREREAQPRQRLRERPPQERTTKTRTTKQQGGGFVTENPFD